MFAQIDSISALVQFGIAGAVVLVVVIFLRHLGVVTNAFTAALSQLSQQADARNEALIARIDKLTETIHDHKV